jgi:hypothetical protein
MFYAKQISTNQMVTGSHSVPDPSQVFPSVDVSDIETGEISESDFIAHVELTNELAMTYSDHRASSYPSIPDQLDMLWHAMDTGILPKVDSFYSINKSVKDKYPKE